MEAKHTPGPCHWNGNEICADENPRKGIAGIAPDSPDEWGPLFAAAPKMFEALRIARLEIEAWRNGTNTRTGLNDLSKAKVGACFGGLPYIDAAIADIDGNTV